MSQPSSEPGRIEHDLDQTRARLDSRLSELQDRLSPGQVLDDLMGYFRGSEGADFSRSLLDSVRANPLPAAVTGIGLAWLMAANPRGAAPSAASVPSGRVRVYSRTSAFDEGGSEAMVERLHSAEEGVARHPDEAEHAYAERLDQARGQAMGLARHAQETTESFGQRLRDVLASAAQSLGAGAQDLRDQAGAAAGATGSAVGSLGTGLRSGAQAAGGAMQDAVQGGAQWAGGALSQGGQAAGTAGGNLLAALTDSPVLLGALGVAAGALLGALLPQSEREGEALGGVAGQARDTMRGLAQQAVDGGAHVTQAVLDAGRESAGTHGLTGGRSVGQLVDAALSGDLAGQARQAAADILKAGDDAVRKELPEQGQSAPR